jgi:hypothetical protein
VPRDERSDREPGVPVRTGAGAERPGAQRRERMTMSAVATERGPSAPVRSAESG